MSDTDDTFAPLKDVTIIENQDVDSLANRRRNNDPQVAQDDEDYRLITERRENDEIMQAREYTAAQTLLGLSRKPRKLKTQITKKNTIERKQRPLMRGKTKKKRKRKKGKSTKKKRISRRGKK
jgi:hypothetical protein